MAAQSIRLQLTGEETRRFTKRSTENPDAYEAYMKGRYFWNKRTETGLRKGLDYFRQAIKLHLGFADAYVGVADSYATLGCGARNPGIHLLLLGLECVGVRRSIPACPRRKPSLRDGALLVRREFGRQGQYSETIGEAQRALQDNPHSLIVGSNAGWTLALAGHYDQAIETLKKAIEIDPNFPRTHFRLGEVYEQRGQYAMAIPEFEKAVNLSGGNPYYQGSLEHAYGALRNSDQARSVLQKLQAPIGEKYVPLYAIGLVYVGLGDKDQAFRWLRKAAEDRSTSMVFLRSDPELASLRSDPRFAQLSQLVNF
jgi:tetratricopeptide (TPR) repeat protein